MTYIFVGKWPFIKQRLVELQEIDPIRWDSRIDLHPDFLDLDNKDWELSERHARNILNGDV